MTERTRLTMAQALVRFLCAQHTLIDGQQVPLFNGVFGIFGHGNVTGLGEAMEDGANTLPVYRAHNEQSMAHLAIAYAKATKRQRMMACTTSVGPGATNMVTAAALAHVNRLPVLLLPGDTFASRLPDPVLQQVEDFGDPTISANDCFRPVSRFWDRITRPEQLLQSLPQAMQVLTDPVNAGPVTLALPQDVQAQAWDYPNILFEPKIHARHRTGADMGQLQTAADLIRSARRPLIIAGGGVHYSDAMSELDKFASKWNIPVAETQAGKSALPWDHHCNVGAIGVTGSAAANDLAQQSDLLIAIGTRLQDFTTGSGFVLDGGDRTLLSINVARYDAAKRFSVAIQGDALRSLQEIDSKIKDSQIDPDWIGQVKARRQQWNLAVTDVTSPTGANLPGDAEVIGAVNHVFASNATVVAAAGGIPGELHKLWRASDCDGYHLEYGFSCMGYEIAGGIGVKMALPQRDVVVMVGDGSYLMMNSEIATAVALGQKLIIVVLNNQGFGCINRLQTSLGGKSYNNLWQSSYPSEAYPDIDFVQHARSLGAQAEKAESLDELSEALKRAQQSSRTSVVVIDTDPAPSTEAGGAWWDVPVAEISDNPDVQQAAEDYQQKLKSR